MAVQFLFHIIYGFLLENRMKTVYLSIKRPERGAE